jgi:hypothetical protein
MKKLFPCAFVAFIIIAAFSALTMTADAKVGKTEPCQLDDFCLKGDVLHISKPKAVSFQLPESIFGNLEGSGGTFYLTTTTSKVLIFETNEGNGADYERMIHVMVNGENATATIRWQTASGYSTPVVEVLGEVHKSSVYANRSIIVWLPQTIAYDTDLAICLSDVECAREMHVVDSEWKPSMAYMTYGGINPIADSIHLFLPPHPNHHRH